MGIHVRISRKYLFSLAPLADLQPDLPPKPPPPPPVNARAHGSVTEEAKEIGA